VRAEGMELYQLWLLETVIESGGYAQAGKILSISHSAIHRQIRLLEEELDCQLLQRSGRRVHATECGRLLAELTVRVRQEISEAQRRIADLTDLRSGTVRVGTSSSILVSFLPAVLQRFSKQFPGVRVQLLTGIADDLLEDVLEGKLDLAIVFNPSDLPRPLPRLECEVLYREEFDWAVAKSHPLAKRNRVDLAELATYPLITLPPRSHLRRACDRFFAAKGMTATVITELENEEAIEKLIEIGMGVALRSTRRPSNARIHCFRIGNRSLQCEVGIVVQKTSYAPRARTEFIQMCRSAKVLEPKPASV
jgi:DNA-binding transcriptional LysR family regulator